MHRSLPALFLGLLCLATLSAPVGAQSEGTAREVYLAYHEALKRSFTMDGVWSFYSNGHQAEIRRIYPSGTRNKAFYLMKAASPPEVRIISERDEGDRVTLTLRPPADGRGLEGTAVLIRELDGWKIDEVVWRRR